MKTGPILGEEEIRAIYQQGEEAVVDIVLRLIKMNEELANCEKQQK
jgi:hypothetical protein